MASFITSVLCFISPMLKMCLCTRFENTIIITISCLLLSMNCQIMQEQLRTWISANVSACPHSIFVFDEMEKMPPGLMDGIKPFLDHHENVNGVDYR